MATSLIPRSSVGARVVTTGAIQPQRTVDEEIAHSNGFDSVSAYYAATLALRNEQENAMQAAGGMFSYPYANYRAFVIAKRAHQFFVPKPTPEEQFHAVVEQANRIELATETQLDGVWQDERFDINGAGGRLILYGAGLGLAGLGAGLAAGIAIGGTAGGPYGLVIGAAVGVTVGIVLALFPFQSVNLIANYRTMLGTSADADPREGLSPVERWPLYCQTRRLVTYARAQTRLPAYSAFRYGNYGNYNITGGAEASAFLLGEALFETESMILDTSTGSAVTNAEDWNAAKRWCALWAIGDLPDELNVNQSRYYNKAAITGHPNAWVHNALLPFANRPAGEVRSRLNKDLGSLDTLPPNGTAVSMAVERNIQLAAHAAERRARVR